MPGLDLRTKKLLLIEASRKHRKAAPPPQAAINITPLVDVVLVLLIIFMVVTPMLEGKIELPKVLEPSPWSIGESDLHVSLDKKGVLSVDTHPLELDALPRALERELKSRPGRPVFLEADRSLDFGSLRPVLTALRNAGAPSVALASNPLEAK